MFKFIIIVLGVSFPLQTFALQGFCFNESVNLERVKRLIKPFLLEGEAAFKRPSVNCLELKLINKDRKELVEGLLSQRYMIVRSYSSSDKSSLVVKNEIVRPGNCRIEIVTKENKRLEKRKVRIGRKVKVIDTEVEGSGASISQMLLGDGKPGLLRMNGDEYYIVCKKRSENIYEITLNIDRNFSQESLSSSVVVSRGSPVNLGSLKKDLDNKKKKISLSQGLELKKSKGNRNYNYTLFIK